MEYRKLGKWGIKVSALSVGAFKTFGQYIDDDTSEAIMKTAYDAGINYFDGAEAYGLGAADEFMGRTFQKMGWPRDTYIIAGKASMTKFEEPTKRGNARKHLVEVCEASLRRFRTDHLDFFFCHRPDFDTPVEEVVRTMNDLMTQGKILYWGTSDHPADMLMDMHAVAEKMHMEGPHMEQTWYNMLGRKRIEDELVPLFERYGMGSTVYQPLHGGILTGKYQNGIPEGSRLDKLEWTRSDRTEVRLARVRRLGELAQELGLSMPVFAVAWVLKNPHVSTAVLGASKPEQIAENVQAVEAQKKLTDDVMERIRDILGEQLQI
jgi:voltage-dependent potassium channel beta subunit